MRRVVVTGLGCVSPLGVGVKQTWSRLVAGHSGIASTAHLGVDFEKLPSRVAGLVPTTDPGAWDASQHARKGEDRTLPLFTRYALAASHEALQDAGLLAPDKTAGSSDLTLEATAPSPDRIGVSLGSGIGDLATAYDTSLAFDKRGHHAVHPLFVPRLLLNLAGGHVALRYGLQGPNLCPTSACTTGAHAIADAFFRLAHLASATDIFLAGASEACIHPLALSAFARARALSTAHNDSPATASRPFDAGRDGFVIAEGAATLVLESLDSARSRGAHIYAELLGVGESCDAYHVTSPPENGRGAAAAMRAALQLAQVDPSKVDYVNAHATGTRTGDVAENRAIRTVLLDESQSSSPRDACTIAVGSTKGATGHLLGAAGSLEAMATVLTLQQGSIPPTLNLERFDDDDNSSHSTNWPFCYPGLPQSRGLLQNLPPPTLAVSNSFGFGGTNASLVLRRWDDAA